MREEPSRAMQAMVSNYINGNLTDAKRQAKRFGVMRIREHLIYDLGFSEAKATATARFLKGQVSFMEVCDA